MTTIASLTSGVRTLRGGGGAGGGLLGGIGADGGDGGGCEGGGGEGGAMDVGGDEVLSGGSMHMNGRGRLQGASFQLVAEALRQCSPIPASLGSPAFHALYVCVGSGDGGKLPPSPTQVHTPSVDMSLPPSHTAMPTSDNWMKLESARCSSSDVTHAKCIPVDVHSASASTHERGW